MVVLVFTASLAACGGGTPVSSVRGRDIKPLTKVAVPTDLLGLRVAPEDVKGAIDPARRSQVDALRMYSIRDGDLLAATLQVSRLRDQARLQRPAFRSLVVAQIGSSVPHVAKLGSTTVYLTTGTKQRISVWFRGRYFFVLAVRDDFRHPRALLRRAVAIEP